MNTAEQVISGRPSFQGALALLRAANLPVADLTTDHLEHFFYCGSVESPCGLVGIELFGRSALLRSLTVAPDARSSGLGRALVRHAEEHAKSQGAKAIFLLTTTAEGFFARRGYTRLPRDAAPAEIRASREFSTLCPSSSVFMGRVL